VHTPRRTTKRHGSIAVGKAVVRLRVAHRFQAGHRLALASHGNPGPPCAKQKL
ncbi:unnamed protein product, partial [Amoebophrya sp. A25]